MKLTKKSKQLMIFLTKNKYIHPLHNTKKTNAILKELYDDILNAYHFLLSIKQKKGNYYNLKTKKITTASQITKPQNFNSKSFPDAVRTHIDEATMT